MNAVILPPAVTRRLTCFQVSLREGCFCAFQSPCVSGVDGKGFLAPTPRHEITGLDGQICPFPNGMGAISMFCGVIKQSDPPPSRSKTPSRSKCFSKFLSEV